MTSAYVRRRPAGEDVGGDTDRSRYTLDQIWDMVKTEDGQVTHTQVDAWRRLAELCHEQADQLEKAVNQLRQRWPARSGSASAAFARLVTQLIASMRQAAEAGAANQAPLRSITDALTDARFVAGRTASTTDRPTSRSTGRSTPAPRCCASRSARATLHS